MASENRVSFYPTAYTKQVLKGMAAYKNISVSDIVKEIASQRLAEMPMLEKERYFHLGKNDDS